MTTSLQQSATVEPSAAVPVFSRILVGVDGTPASFDACRQVALLAEPGAAVEAVAVVHLGEIALAGMDAPALADEVEREADEALDEAVAILGDGTTRRRLNGFVVAALRREVEVTSATLLALGTHDHRRVTEIVLGGVVGELLHVAPCSVLVARPADDTFPRTIVVGYDGSGAATAALEEASRLATRFDAQVRVVAAAQDRHIDLERVRAAVPSVDVVAAHPLDALVAASDTADLLVVGSRGLHGFRALGSVSERVAHQARCSVLVVRHRGPA